MKAALTRTYNKEGLLPPHAAIRIKMITGKSSQYADMVIDGDEEENDEEEEQDITKDTMIKVHSCSVYFNCMLKQMTK